MRPLFGTFLRGSSAGYSSNPMSGALTGTKLGKSQGTRNTNFDQSGFERMSERGNVTGDDDSLGDTGSEIELRARTEGISVKTDIDIKVEEQGTTPNGRGMGIQHKDGIRTMVKGLV